MSRFIFYSGLAHCLAFAGVVTYLSTTPKENLPSFLQNKSTPHIEVSSQREIVELGVASGSQARESSEEMDSNRELRDRKVRANLPTPPETPRVVDKVKAAKKVSKQVPTQLPAKKGATTDITPSGAEDVASVPEMGSDIPVQEQPIDTQNSENNTEDLASENTEAVAEVAAVAQTQESPSEQTSNDEVSAEESPTEENLQIAAFDVDELAETHLQKVKEKEELAHQERMAKLAAEKAALLASLAAEKTASSEGQNEGDNQSNGGTAAVSNEVRALSELRQSPGNKVPQYDVEDRRQGRQGLVVFLAYIKADGLPKEFQLASSSGHRSLDAKTLKTLKSWKFQPGQEGWVEIPFQWDLKGGAQEAKTGLRRQVSRQ